jgi:hypothetical protein
MLSGRLGRKSTSLVALFLITVSLYLYTQSALVVNQLSHHNKIPLATLPCKLLPGANDTVVILKTGSTELQDKLPIHLETTLRCYPNYLIFSDYAEQYQGETIIDALEDVDPIFKTAHQDFDLYRQLQKGGRSSLKPSDLSGPASYAQDGTNGKPTNPGWRLDKWKFLPMIRKTLRMYPDKEWYVFVETDTYIFWSTLLSYLAVLDSTQHHYIGAQSEIGDVIFAHGGSGFALSRPALEAAVDSYVENKASAEAFTASQWAGDCVLGKTLFDSGTNLTWAWPMWQGNDNGNMNYSSIDYGKRLWCYPTVSYHHIAPPAIESLWRFEQTKIAQQGEGHSTVIRQKDVFAEYILPQTSKPRLNWNNHADQDRGRTDLVEACRDICEQETSCLQYAYDEYGNCKVAEQPKLGEVSTVMQSGWFQERMQLFHDKAESCEGEGWIV